jgi:hypothetical protein
VCAIIAPGLCTPMILRLPFLVHNDIVVDAAARTVIDKKCGFDLLHPVPPPLPPPPKQKLKDFFKELQQDHKLMVAELKLVCHDRCCHMEYKFEVLTMQKELQRLGDQIKNEFLNVFSEIPHIDKLPTDVYCCIKLKDTSKYMQTRTYSTP